MKNKFYFYISLLYILIVVFTNFIAAMLPVGLDMMIINDDLLICREIFSGRFAVLSALLPIACFAIPTVFSLWYSLSILTAADFEAVERKIVNSPTFFSAIGVSGWILNLVFNVFVILFVHHVAAVSVKTLLLFVVMVTVIEELICFELSYYSLEALNRLWVLPKLFPSGGVSGTKGIIRPSFSFLFVEFFISVVVGPVLFLLYTVIVQNIKYTGQVKADALIVVGTFMLFSILITLFFMKIFTVPINKIFEGTRRIKSGDYSAEIHFASNDKMGVLCDTFNEMTASLQEKEFMRDTFGKIVDPYVRDHLLNGNISLGGESCTVTVLFCDIRGFTALSEKMKPEVVVFILNRYFTKLGACITDNHGIINKYIGDALMAIFGAPVKSPSHAEDAVRAALEMRTALVELNEEFARSGLPDIQFGIGLHSGIALAGNIGAESRMEYTVIGDTVNTASRIESLCKQYRTDVLLSEHTAQMVSAPETKRRLRYMDEGEIRGKTEKVRLFTLSA